MERRSEEDEDHCLSCQEVDLFRLSVSDEATSFPLPMISQAAQEKCLQNKFPSSRTVASESSHFGEENLKLFCSVRKKYMLWESTSLFFPLCI